jgi:hypothetical protein
LGLEEFAMLQAVADRAQAEERIALGLVRALLGVLVGAEVERADGARPAGKKFERAPIRAKLSPVCTVLPV